MTMKNFFIALVLTGLFLGILLLAGMTQNQGCLPWKEPITVGGGGAFSENRGDTVCRWPPFHGAAPESNRPSRGLHDRTSFEDPLGHRAHAAPPRRLVRRLRAPRYARARDEPHGRVRTFSVRREVALGLGLYALYLLVARLVLRRDGRTRARRNAERIVELERRAGLDVEPAVQRALLRSPRLVHGLNAGYGLFNVTLTVGWLTLLFRRRDEGYHRFRRTCLLAHLGAQPVFYLLPTAPPRVLDGFVDTMSEVSGFDLEHPLLVRFYNPVAAMPSLHVAFAVVTGAEIAARSDSVIVRSVAHAYAPLVATVVAGTANHYVLDAVAGAALGAFVRRLNRAW